MKSSTKVWLFLFFTCMTFLWVGELLGDRLGLFLGFIAACIFMVLVFFFGETHLLKNFTLLELKGQDPWGLQKIVSAYADKLQIPSPKLYLIESKSPTAFSYALPWKRGQICVTTGLLKKMTEQEVDAIMAYQVCHLKQLDSFTFNISFMLANTILGAAMLIDNLLGKKFKNPVQKMVIPIAWALVRIKATKKTFFANDFAASSLITNKKVLAEALWKLESLSVTLPLLAPPCTSHLFIVHPQGWREKNWLQVSHPSVEQRLKRLIGRYPI